MISILYAGTRQAVAIGHVGPEGGVLTAQVLAEMAPELEKEGIRFVTVSELAGSH